MPGALLCTVGTRLTKRPSEEILRALASLDKRPEGVDLLKTLRMKRFEPVDAKALESARRSFAAAGARPSAAPAEPSGG
jgi:hypothetical protein